MLATTAYTPRAGLRVPRDLRHRRAIDRGTADPAARDFCTSGAPFRFVVDLPEGNYRVTVTLGDADGESLTTVRAESRRLMLEHVATARGEFVDAHASSSTPATPGWPPAAPWR